MKKYSRLLACVMAGLLFLSPSPALIVSGAAETAQAPAASDKKAPTADAATETTYKVSSGDTLWKIADKFYGDGEKWKVIYEANKDKLSSPGTIVPGQELVIPASGGSSPDKSSKAKSKDKAKNSSKDKAKDSSKDKAKDSSKDKAKDSSKDKVKDSSKDKAKDSSKDKAKDSSKDKAKDSSTETTEDNSKDISNENSTAGSTENSEKSPDASSDESGMAPMTEFWTEGSRPAQELRDYVAKVTDPADEANFIPEKDRIAVFDMDGTLVCETYYTYYDTMMFIEYCLHDHPERVSDELKEVAAAIKPGYVADEALARNFAKAYAGMTVEEFRDYIVEFGQKKTASFNNMRYIDNFYLPMVELVKYLYDNGFTIYVISGTERTTTRAIVANSPISDYVTPNHVIGTDFEIKVKGHETESSNMNFKYVNGDELVLTGGFIQKDLNANKTIYIEREIGQRPVLAFGNSGSDTSMMNYTIESRNKYPAQAYMVVADDSVREWGKQDWAEKSAEYESMGYIPVSMKDDFAQIYPEDVTKAEEQYVPAQTQEQEQEDEDLAPAA